MQRTSHASPYAITPTHDATDAARDTAFAKKISSVTRLSDDDLLPIADLHRRRRSFAVGQELYHEGQSDQRAFVLASGWACSYKVLENGTRQILEFQLPGDLIGLRSVLFHRANHSVETITEVQASEVLQRDFRQIFTQTPQLAMAVLAVSAKDAAMVVEHLITLSQRSAAERISHLFLELGLRLDRVGIGNQSGFPCPLSQYQLADYLGLTSIHTNRILRALRELGLLTFQKGQVVFLDYQALVDYARFDPAYLNHDCAMSPDVQGDFTT